MVDTLRTRAALVSLLADNSTGDIDPQDIRDLLYSTGVAASASAIPGSAPASLKDFVHDSTNKEAYLAAHTSVAGDYKKINVGYKLLSSWTFSINVTQVDFTGLAPYTDFLFIARNVTTASSG